MVLAELRPARRRRPSKSLPHGRAQPKPREDALERAPTLSARAGVRRPPPRRRRRFGSLSPEDHDRAVDRDVAARAAGGWRSWPGRAGGGRRRGQRPTRPADSAASRARRQTWRAPRLAGKLAGSGSTSRSELQRALELARIVDRQLAAVRVAVGGFEQRQLADRDGRRDCDRIDQRVELRLRGKAPVLHVRRQRPSPRRGS